MQKFVPRSRVGIFRNEHTQSTLWTPRSCFVTQIHVAIFQIECTQSNPLDPKPCFGAFRSVWFIWNPFITTSKFCAKRAELVQSMQKFVPRSRVGIFRNERTQSNPLDCKSIFCAFRSVWVHLQSFRNCIKLGAKWGELVQLMQKVVPQSHIEIFRNKRNQSTPLDPKVMFLCVS
jgi:hypothetical protein